MPPMLLKLHFFFLIIKNKNQCIVTDLEKVAGSELYLYDWDALGNVIHDFAYKSYVRSRRSKVKLNLFRNDFKTYCVFGYII
jgi:hypothetical protein